MILSFHCKHRLRDLIMRTAFVFLTLLMLVVASVTASGRLYLILAGSSGIQALAFTTLFDN